MSASPPTTPSAGVFCWSSSLLRRRSRAAKTSGPYSRKLPSSTSSARLSRAAPAAPARPAAGRGGRGLDGAGAVRVEAELVPAADLLQVFPFGVEVDLVGLVPVVPVVVLDGGEQLTLADGVAHGHGEPADGAAGGKGDDVLHLHRLEDDDRAAGLDRRPGRRFDGDDRARDGGMERVVLCVFGRR